MFQRLLLRQFLPTVLIWVICVASYYGSASSKPPSPDPALAHSPLTTSNFSQAAQQNARLKTELTWFFGGKTQRGWYLYEALIGRLLDTAAQAESPAFAAALAQWQQTNGLAPSGVLEQNTWMRMVATFQARRIKDRSVPPTARLLQAPAAEFYDPARPEELRQVERAAFAAYQRMMAAAAADQSLQAALTRQGQADSAERYLKIVSAFRSPSYQAMLRKRSPNSGRAGLARYSPHFTGRALDLYVGGEPVSTADRNRALQINTPVYQWLVENADRFGFQPYFYEPWHWEYCPPG